MKVKLDKRAILEAFIEHLKDDDNLNEQLRLSCFDHASSNSGKTWEELGEDDEYSDLVTAAAGEFIHEIYAQLDALLEEVSA